MMLRKKIGTAPNPTKKLHATIRNAHGKNDFTLIKQIYKAGLTAGNADVFIHNIMIIQAGRHADYKTVTDVYDHAVQTGIADMITHSSVICAANQTVGVFGWLAMKAYSNALVYLKKTGLFDVGIHGAMIISAGNSKMLSWANMAYQNALKSDIFLTAYTHNVMIVAAGQCNDINAAYNAYRNALNSKTANVVTHTSMIKTASLCGRFELALIAYKNALIEKVANNRTHEAYKYAEEVYQASLSQSVTQSTAVQVQENKAPIFSHAVQGFSLFSKMPWDDELPSHHNYSKPAPNGP